MKIDLKHILIAVAFVGIISGAYAVSNYGTNVDANIVNATQVNINGVPVSPAFNITNQTNTSSTHTVNVVYYNPEPTMFLSVTFYAGNVCFSRLYSDGANPPTTLLSEDGMDNSGTTKPHQHSAWIRKGNYYTITTSGTCNIPSPNVVAWTEARP